MSERRLADKIAPPDLARARIEAWRNQGLEVAVARGAFDLIGVEHARFLAAVRGRAARLVVVLEDETGAPGAVLAAPERATLVAGLRVVDLVVVGDALSGEVGASALASPAWSAGGSGAPPRAPASGRLRERVVAADGRAR